jgi:hypothetical protein
MNLQQHRGPTARDLSLERTFAFEADSLFRLSFSDDEAQRLYKKHRGPASTADLPLASAYALQAILFSESGL